MSMFKKAQNEANKWDGESKKAEQSGQKAPIRMYAERAKAQRSMNEAQRNINKVQGKDE